MDTSRLIIDFNKRFTLPRKARSYMPQIGFGRRADHGDGTFHVDPAALVAASTKRGRVRHVKRKDYVRNPKGPAPSLPAAAQTPLDKPAQSPIVQPPQNKNLRIAQRLAPVPVTKRLPSLPVALALLLRRYRSQLPPSRWRRLPRYRPRRLLSLELFRCKARIRGHSTSRRSRNTSARDQTASIRCKPTWSRC